MKARGRYAPNPCPVTTIGSVYRCGQQIYCRSEQDGGFVRVLLVERAQSLQPTALDLEVRRDLPTFAGIIRGPDVEVTGCMDSLK